MSAVTVCPNVGANLEGHICLFGIAENFESAPFRKLVVTAMLVLRAPNCSRYICLAAMSEGGNGAWWPAKARADRKKVVVATLSLFIFPPAGEACGLCPCFNPLSNWFQKHVYWER